MKDHKQVRIAVVDNHEENRYVITDLLRRVGFKVDEGRSGADALRLAASPIDLLILDAHLPDVSGIEVCRQIKADAHTAKTPILQISAISLQIEDRVECPESGADGYLAQPIAPQELLTTVRALVRVRKAEEQTRLLSEQWQSAFNALPDGVALLDHEGRIVQCNRMMEAILGKSCDAICGHSCDDLIDEAFGQPPWSLFFKMRESLRREVLEQKSDEHWYRRTCNPVLDSAGMLKGGVYLLSDITGHKQVEGDLAMLAHLPKENPAPVLRIMQDGRLSYFNDAGRPIAAAWQDEHGRVNAVIQELVASAFSSGQILEREMSIDARRYSVIFKPIHKDVCVNVYGRDITELKHAEEALRASEEQLRATFTHAAIGIAHVGLDGRFLMVNQRICEITGYTQEDLLRRTFQNITHPDDLQPDLNKVEAIVRGEIDSYSLEKRYLRPDGSTVWVNLIVSALRDDSGAVQHFISFIKDISDRKQIELELRHSNERFQALADATFEGVVISQKGRIQDVNQQMLQMTGYSREEMIGRELKDFLLEEERDGILEKLLRGNESVTEHHLQKQDGNLITVESHGKPTVYQGCAAQLTATRDITEEKRAVETLREHERRLSTIMNNLPVGVWLADRHGHILLGNPAGQRIWAGSRYVGPERFGEYKGWWLDTGKRIEPDEWALARAVNQGETSLNEIIEIESFDGSHKIISNSAVPIWDEDGRVDGAVALNMDVTQQYRAEAALRESESNLRSFYNSSPVLMGIVELREGDILHISDNPATADFFGITPDATRNQLASQLGAPATVIELWSRHYREAAARHAPVHFEYLHEDGGDNRWLSVTVSPILINGAPGSKFCYVAEDITEHKRTEEEIRCLNESLRRSNINLEAVNRELEAFAYSVSHDLRAPLRSMDGFSKALLEDLGDKLDKQGRNYLERIRAASQRMAQLIDDLLNLSRVNRSQIKLELVDLGAIALEVGDTLRRENPDRAVELRVDPKIVTLCDAHLLRIALDNLLRNAWKFTSKRPDAAIEMGKLEQQGRVGFFIRDNGAGFDMTYADNLFTPFQRLHKVQEFPGTGIGLAIVRRVIQRHGGKVWAEGELGRGATFYCML